MLNRFLNPTSMLWLLRQVLQYGGVWLVANGRASQDQVDGVTRAVLSLISIIGDPVLVSAVGTIIGFIGNIFASFRDKVNVGGQAVGVGTIRETVGPAAAREVVQTAKEVIAQKPTLWETWFGHRN